MKLLSLVLMLSSTAAMACPHSQKQFICPGDSVVDSDNSAGIVTAINPFQHTAAYRIDRVGTYSAQIETLALAQGCLEAVCVGDTIYDSDNSAGTVVAINPFDNRVAYRIDRVGTYSADVSTLKVTYGCSLGYCVGDQIVDSDNSNGTIVALSPYDDNAAYRIDRVGTYAAQIETLSSTQYCAQYGDNHPARRAKHYPSMPTSRYSAPSFHYYPTRK
jgi:serine protease inhibitor ecotin